MLNASPDFFISLLCISCCVAISLQPRICPQKVTKTHVGTCNTSIGQKNPRYICLLLNKNVTCPEYKRGFMTRHTFVETRRMHVRNIHQNRHRQSESPTDSWTTACLYIKRCLDFEITRLMEENTYKDLADDEYDPADDLMSVLLLLCNQTRNLKSCLKNA